MMFFEDHEERCSTPKLPLFSFPVNKAAETPGLATPPVNIAGTVPFLWEEAPGKPRACGGDDVTMRKGSGNKQNGVVRCLELPPRLSLPAAEAGGKNTAANEPSPTTVFDGPYVASHRSRSLTRSASLKMGRAKPVKEKGLFGGSARWGSSGKFKEVVEGKFDFSQTTANSIGGGTKVKISRVTRKRRLLDLNLSYSKSHFWERVYEGFKQVIPWRRSRQENLTRMSSSTI